MKISLKNQNLAFTMIEIVIAISIIAILSSFIIPYVQKYLTDAKEVTQITHINSINKAISEYLVDRKMYPRTLNDLVIKGYISKIPTNPFTDKIDWIVQYKSSRFSKELKWEVYNPDDRSRVVTKIKAPIRKY